MSIQYLGQYGESGTDDLIAAIQNQTSELDQSITDAGQGVQDKIESQYDTSQGSEVGSAAQGFADQGSGKSGRCQLCRYVVLRPVRSGHCRLYYVDLSGVRDRGAGD